MVAKKIAVSKPVLKVDSGETVGRSKPIQLNISSAKIPNGIHGGINCRKKDINGEYIKDSDVKAKYDRKSFYAHMFLDNKELPNNYELVPLTDEDKHSKYTIVKFDICAFRPDGSFGMFFARQGDFLNYRDVYMFEFEFKKILMREFRILELANVTYLEPSHEIIDNKLRTFVSTTMKRKEKVDGNPDKTELREELKRRLILPIVSVVMKPNKNFDTMGLSYLQAKARYEMYKEMNYHKDKTLGVHVDEIWLAQTAKRLENDKKWRKSW